MTSVSAYAEQKQQPKITGDLAGSFDFGEYGFAYCIGTPGTTPPVVAGAGVYSIGPASTARCAAMSMVSMFAKFPRLRYVVMEEQPPINRKTGYMEAALAALAVSVPGTDVVHVPPSRVGIAFNLPKKHQQKKTAAVHVMDALILKKNARVDVPNEFVDMLAGVSRRHDVADAFLQFVWFAEVGLKELRENIWCTKYVGASSSSSSRATSVENTSSERRRMIVAEKKVEQGVVKMLKKKRQKRSRVHS